MQVILRQNLGAFIEKSFRELYPALPYLHNWHIDAFAWHLSKVMHGRIKRLLITVPPRSLKSHSASVAFPAWVLGHEPGRRIITVSYGNDLAVEHANAFRKVMKADWYRDLFPYTRIDPGKDREREVRTTDGGYRLTTTVGGPLTGRGGGIIIIDDPMKAVDAESQAARDSVKRWFDETLLTRLDDRRSDVIILIMQRLHVDDLAGHVLAKGTLAESGWVHLNLPAIAEEELRIPIGYGRFHLIKPGDVLHPGRDTVADLGRLKRDMGSAAFSAQYQQSPVPAGGNMIKWAWFGQYSALPEAKWPAMMVQSWDTASKAGELNDYSVGITALVVQDTVYIVDVIREKLDYPSLKNRILRARERWKAQTILIEDKGSGTSLIQDLKRDRCHTIAIKPESDKVVRMSACSARIEAGAVLLPSAASWLDEFRDEILAFPDGRHDDQADALSQLLNWRRRGFYTLDGVG
ncbi:phage terminase large subunit [Pseudochelatococcus lubricantis]|uniref:phage terminase large subunit n=1 Tax=Pseudochelatococcus lubricantis TaxID=1538102 RepID=UPI0035F0F8B1